MRRADAFDKGRLIFCAAIALHPLSGQLTAELLVRVKTNAAFFILAEGLRLAPIVSDGRETQPQPARAIGCQGLLQVVAQSGPIRCQPLVNDRLGVVTRICVIRQPAVQTGLPAQSLQGVAIDIEDMGVGLFHILQRHQLGHEDIGNAPVYQPIHRQMRMVKRQHPHEFIPLAFGTDAAQAGRRIPHQLSQPGIRRQIEVVEKTYGPDHPHRIVMQTVGAAQSQDALFQILHPAQQIEQLAIGQDGDGIDGEIPPADIFLKGHADKGRDVHHQGGVGQLPYHSPDLARRIKGVVGRTQGIGQLTAGEKSVTLDHVIQIMDGATQQDVAHGTADQHGVGRKIQQCLVNGLQVRIGQ